MNLNTFSCEEIFRISFHILQDFLQFLFTVSQHWFMQWFPWRRRGTNPLLELVVKEVTVPISLLRNLSIVYSLNHTVLSTLKSAPNKVW